MTFKKNYAKEGYELKIVTVNLPLEDLAYIHKLMEWGQTPSRSEYVRIAVKNQIRDDFETKRYVRTVISAIDDKDIIRIQGYNKGRPIKVLRRLE